MRFIQFEFVDDEFAARTGTKVETAYELTKNRGRRFSLPTDAGKLAVIATETSRRAKLPGLLYVNQSQVWPSSQNLALAKHVLCGFGMSESIEERPLVILDEDESEKLAAFLGLSLISFWDVMLVDDAMARTTIFTHDEELFVEAKNSSAENDRDSSLTQLYEAVLKKA